MCVLNNGYIPQVFCVAGTSRPSQVCAARLFGRSRAFPECPVAQQRCPGQGCGGVFSNRPAIRADTRLGAAFCKPCRLPGHVAMLGNIQSPGSTDPQWPSIPCQQKVTQHCCQLEASFPELGPTPQVKKHRKHEIEIPALLSRRAGP